MCAAANGVDKETVTEVEWLQGFKARQRGGKEGAGAPPAFQLAEQGEQKCPF